MKEQLPKKIHILSFRVTDDQLIELKARAEKAKIKVKELILKRLFA